MPLFNLNSAELESRLTETIAWCAADVRADFAFRNEIQLYLARIETTLVLMRQGIKADFPKPNFSLASHLRSPILKPSPLLSELRTEPGREKIVQSVVGHRAVLLAESANAIPNCHAARPREGRLLLYWPSENVFDGASEYATGGFFDVEDTPPWDTWVAYRAGTLLSWVPPELVDIAQAGIDANAVDCIQWLNQ